MRKLGAGVPLYVKASCGGCVLHLSEHHGGGMSALHSAFGDEEVVAFE